MGEVSAAEVRREAERPMLYFAHDADAASDMKCRKLVRRWGYEGYGRWWRLCELLAAEHGHRLDMGDADVAGVVADELGMTLEEVSEFVSYLVENSLLKTDDEGHVWSERMAKNSVLFGKKRAAGRAGGKKSRRKANGQGV